MENYLCPNFDSGNMIEIKAHLELPCLELRVCIKNEKVFKNIDVFVQVRAQSDVGIFPYSDLPTFDFYIGN
jgi:hypothetical protein